ncbi:protein lin-54 isoform 1-like protein [Camelus ferus]|nr:protein lin-54 isoform 1-like protein [Camelus ferus]
MEIARSVLTVEENVRVVPDQLSSRRTIMEVVPAEVNSLLPEEIMDTGITLVDDDSIEAVIVSSPIPMETELEEIVNINSTGDSTATPISTEPITVYSNHTNQVAVNTTVTKADSNTTVQPAFPSGLQKLGAQTPVTISANQIILNKVSQTSDLKLGNQTLKPDGQKLILTTLGKSGSPIVLALPHSQPQAQKVTTQAQSGDAKLPPQQIKVVTIGGRPETQQLKTVQAVKSAVQTITVGGVSTSQFKTIIPLATAPNVQQIQVPGSKFHYVRLVTATTASSSTQPVSQNPSTNTQPLQQAKPVVVNTTPVRMSVPLVSAQTVKQVVPKPINPTSQIVTSSQPQQRLIMPATPLPQIQPNLTNLPPGTVLAPAPGTGNVGYAVLPAQYVTQRLEINSTATAVFICVYSKQLKLYWNTWYPDPGKASIQWACLDRNPEAFKPKIGKGKEGESDRRHSKGCNCKRSGCLKNYCECYELFGNICG